MINQTQTPKNNKRKKLALILGLSFGGATAIALATALPLALCHPIGPLNINGSDWGKEVQGGFTEGTDYVIDHAVGTVTYQYMNTPKNYTAFDITIPHRVSDGTNTYDVIIGMGAFVKGTGVNLSGSLTIEDGITSIGQMAFAGCSGLTGTLTIPNSVIAINQEAFNGCSGLTGTLTIPNSVTSINDSVFNGCSSLTSLDLGSVQNIGHSAFAGCSGLTGTLTIPNSVTSINENAFMGCSSLMSLDLGSVQNIGQLAFNGCSSLTSLDLGSAQSIGQMAFAGCSGLTGTLTIPKSVTSIGDYAFSQCEFIALDNQSDSFGYANNVGSACQVLLASVGPFNFANPGSTPIVGSLAVGHLEIPADVVYIGQMAFAGCSGLTGTLTIPTNVNFIAYDAFDNCKFTALDNESGSFGYANNVGSACQVLLASDGPFDFANPGSTLIVGKLAVGHLEIPTGVLSIGNNAFFGCSGLTGTLTIPNTVISIGNNAFYSCNALTGLDLTDFTGTIDSAAMVYNTKLKTIYVSSTPTFTITFTMTSSFCKIGINAIFYTPNGSTNSSAEEIFLEMKLGNPTLTWQAGTPPAGFHS